MKELESELCDWTSVLETKINWMTTVVADARGENHRELWPDKSAMEKAQEYVIQDDQYVFVVNCVLV